MITVDDLLHVDIFKELPKEDLTALIPHLIEKKFPEGITIIYRGDPGSSMFMTAICNSSGRLGISVMIF